MDYMMYKILSGLIAQYMSHKPRIEDLVLANVGQFACYVIYVYTECLSHRRCPCRTLDETNTLTFYLLILYSITTTPHLPTSTIILIKNIPRKEPHNPPPRLPPHQRLQLIHTHIRHLQHIPTLQIQPTRILPIYPRNRS